MSKWLPYLILSRILDIVSTIVFVSLWGVGVEGNPFARMVISQGFVYVILLNILVVAVLALFSSSRIGAAVIKGTTVMFFVVVLWNVCWTVFFVYWVGTN